MLIPSYGGSQHKDYFCPVNSSRAAAERQTAGSEDRDRRTEVKLNELNGLNRLNVIVASLVEMTACRKHVL